MQGVISAAETVVLVTGASNGIGRAIADLLARSGFRVFGTSRRPQKAAPLEGVTYVALDLTDSGSIRACVEEVLARAGRIDALVNNAGLIGPGTASEEVDIQTVRDLFETNFFGVVQMTNAVLPHMRARRQGRIINISSTAAQAALPPFFGFYSASKHALDAYSESLRYEVRPFGIQVAMVEPGYTQTEIGENIRQPDHPVADYAAARRRVTLINKAGLAYGSPPEQVARDVLRVLRARRPALRAPSGLDSRALLFARRLLPEPLYDLLTRWMFFGWKPPRPMDETRDLPAPADLGLHGLLFHGPTFRRWFPAALFSAGAVAAAAAAAAVAARWIRRK